MTVDPRQTHATRLPRRMFRLAVVLWCVWFIGGLWSAAGFYSLLVSSGLALPAIWVWLLLTSPWLIERRLLRRCFVFSLVCSMLAPLTWYAATARIGTDDVLWWWWTLAILVVHLLTLWAIEPGWRMARGLVAAAVVSTILTLQLQR